MANCKKILGSKAVVSFLPQIECESVPLVQRVELDTAVVALAESINLALAASYTPPGGVAYSGTTEIPLYNGTVLYFGVAGVPVTVIGDYSLTQTAQAIQTAPVATAIADATTADSYLMGQVCVTSANVASPAQTVATNENCKKGLLTNTIVGFNRTMAINGFVSESNALWDTFYEVGKDIGYCHYSIDYDRSFSEYGVVQVSFFDFTNNDATNVLGFQSTGQIQDFKIAKPKRQLSPAELIVENTRRRLMGLALYK